MYAIPTQRVLPDSDFEKNRKNFRFCRAVEMDFQHLAGLRNVSVD